MPLTNKGEEVMSAMKQEYGSEKGEEVFYASKNAGKISGVDNITSVISSYNPFVLQEGTPVDMVFDPSVTRTDIW